MAQDNKALCRRLVNEVINQGNLATADALVGSNYIYHGPGFELRGLEGFKQMVTTYRTAFPDLTLTIDDIIAEGDKVVTRWTGRGTHRGDLQGIAPTGRTTTVAGILISRFADGKLVEDWEAFDEVGMLRQLGVTSIPAPAHV